MTMGFHDGSRSLQDRFDTRNLADRIDGLLVGDTFDEDDRSFIQERDMFFLATADAEGRPTCSYKGGEPGFVRVLDSRTLAFPNYDGNGMYLSAGNILVNPDVGLLFIDFGRGRRLRLEGTASIDPADPLLADYPEAQFVVRVRARTVYPNCPRYIHRYALVQPSRFVPHAESLTARTGPPTCCPSRTRPGTRAAARYWVARRRPSAAGRLIDPPSAHAGRFTGGQGQGLGSGRPGDGDAARRRGPQQPDRVGQADHGSR